MVGKTVSHYEITRLLGAGGMGEVYAARDTLLGRKVAIKVMRPQDWAIEESRLRFLQEARAASALKHPNIVTIYGIVHADDGDCIVMEFVDGETLEERLLRGPVPLDETLAILDGIADALSAAHARGILHRDLKPANVMLTPSGGLKILDFGLAKLFDSGPDLPPLLRTQSGLAVGTPSFMSPEQARGQMVDARSDLFSLGSMGVEMLTGHNPFEADTDAGVMIRIASGERPSLVGVPEEAIPMFARLLAFDKADRHQSADELRRDIGALRARAGIRTRRLPLLRRAIAALTSRK